MIPGTCKHRGTDGCQHSYNLHIHDHFSFANVRWETWSVWSLILTLLQQEPPSLTIVMSHMTFQKLVPDGQNIAQWPKQDPEHIFIARENFPPFTCCQLLTQGKCTHSIELHLYFCPLQVSSTFFSWPASQDLPSHKPSAGGSSQ